MTATPGNLHYSVWEAQGIRMYVPVTYICFDFLIPPTEATLLALKRSPFMYGYFAGRACWHGVKTPEAETLMREILGS